MKQVATVEESGEIHSNSLVWARNVGFHPGHINRLAYSQSRCSEAFNSFRTCHPSAQNSAEAIPLRAKGKVSLEGSQGSCGQLKGSSGGVTPENRPVHSPN